MQYIGRPLNPLLIELRAIETAYPAVSVNDLKRYALDRPVSGARACEKEGRVKERRAERLRHPRNRA